MNSAEKLTEIFRKFPTVGSRTASRFVYHIMKLPKEKIDELIGAILEVKNRIKLCGFCFNPFEPLNPAQKLCSICLNSTRNRNLLCVVEKEADLLSIEKTGKYQGIYFILGGTLATMRKEDLSNLRTEEFKKRITQGNFSEIILALNPTPEGRATSILIERIIKETIPSPAFKITHLARGIPVGGELEYADEETLQSALEDRK